MADNGYTKNYQDGQALTETKLDTAYKSLKLDISNTTQMTQGATPGYYLKCITAGGAAAFSALPTDVVSSKSSSYVITDTDGIHTILVTTGTAAITITLPTAGDNTDRVLVIKKVDSGVGTVIIAGEGSEDIDGSTTKTLLKQYESIQIQCNGASWYMLSWNTPTYLEQLVTSYTNFPTSAETVEVASLSLKPGEWEISAAIQSSANGATVTRQYFGIGTASGNNQTGMVEGVNTVDCPIPLTGTRGAGGALASYRLVVAATTTYYLKLLGTYTTATPQYTCRLNARRIKP